MRKLFALLFTLGVTLGMAASANAQVLKFAVPFDFSVNGKTMPASTYIVRKSFVNSSTALDFVGNGHGFATLASNVDSTSTGSKLVFLRVDGEYFLSELVTSSGTLHFRAPRKELLQRAGDAAQSLTIDAGQ